MDKYVLTNETKVVKGKTLYRIKALKDFNAVKAGDLGGFIEKEENLSQKGNAWVYNDACVYDNAQILDNVRIYDNAWVGDNAQIRDNVRIYDDALVCSNAQVWEDAVISGNVCVDGNVLIHGHAHISDSVQIYDKAHVFGIAQVFGHAKVYNQAQVFENARIFGDAQIRADVLVCSNAVISQEQYVSYGVVRTDLSKIENLASSIKAQCNLPVIDNKVIAYKLVRPDLTSFHDETFQYEIGKEAEVKDCDESDKSCASGLHFSNITYWESAKRNSKYIYLEAEIDLSDIITVQQGKIRCRKAKILRSFSLD